MTIGAPNKCQGTSLEDWLSRSRALLTVTRHGEPVGQDESLLVTGLFFGCVLAISIPIREARLPERPVRAGPDWLPIHIGLHIDWGLDRAVKLGYQIHGVHEDLKSLLETHYLPKFPKRLLA